MLPHLSFDPGSAVPFHRQIYDSYRSAIMAGRLRSGDRLPASRVLADDLGISRMPVQHAYEQLLHEGYTEARVGSGTFVAEAVPDDLERPVDIGSPMGAARSGPPRDGSPDSLSRADCTLPVQYRILGPFQEGLPALDEFPHRLWARLLQTYTRRLPRELMSYGDLAGYGPLREAITDHLRIYRSVHCAPDQVFVVSGSQMAIHIVALALLEPGDAACIEEPGYRHARHALRQARARILPIPVDHAGMDMSQLPRTGERARVIYVTPAHQYPLGPTLPAARRLTLTEWAERNSAWIIEDDYDGEYRYDGQPLPSLHGLALTDQVIYIGTFSKTMFPSLRIGYIVVPRQLVPRFRRVRNTIDLGSPLLYQAVLADFLSGGHFVRHVRLMRKLYGARRRTLLGCLNRDAQGALDIATTEPAGLHLTVLLPDGVDDRVVVHRAADRGVSASPLSPCYSGPSRRSGLILGFAAADERKTDTALRTLIATLPVARYADTYGVEDLGGLDVDDRGHEPSPPSPRRR